MPTRTELFIDKLSFTLQVERELRDSVVSAFEHEAITGNLLRVTNWSTGLLKSYSRAYQMPLGGEEKLSVQLVPYIDDQEVGQVRRRNRRFMRVEWNPTKAGVVDRLSFQRIFGLLSRCIPNLSLERFFADASLTRVDISFDVFGLRIDRLSVITTLRKPNSRFAMTPAGRMNSMEFGRPNSDRYLLIYDKRLELASRPRTSLPHGNQRVIRRVRERTRFELRLHDIGRLDGLFEEPNPLMQYTVREVSVLSQKFPAHLLAYFSDSCLRRGMQAALSLIENRRERASYVSLLREHSPPRWWDPVQIWGELPNAIRRALTGPI